MVSKNCKQLQLITLLIKCTTYIKTQKLLQVCKQVANKSVHNLSTSCIRTACSQFVETNLEQVVNKM